VPGHDDGVLVQPSPSYPTVGRIDAGINTPHLRLDIRAVVILRGPVDGDLLAFGRAVAGRRNRVHPCDQFMVPNRIVGLAAVRNIGECLSYGSIARRGIACLPLTRVPTAWLRCTRGARTCCYARRSAECDNVAHGPQFIRQRAPGQCEGVIVDRCDLRTIEIREYLPVPRRKPLVVGAALVVPAADQPLLPDGDDL